MLTRQTLSDGYRRQLAGCRPSLLLELDGKKVLLVHGSPDNPLNGNIYPDSDMDPFKNQLFDAVFMGHTHRPFFLRQGKMMILNVGSCGLPRDQGNLLSCAIYDTGSGAADIFRISMDVDWLVGQYHGRLHQNVVDCLMRKSQGPVFGKVLEQ
jgi:predicted phosphodiesterase